MKLNMGNKIYNFKDSLIAGKLGEDIVIDYIKKKNYFQSIEDVSEIRKYQNKDIDLLCVDKYGKEYSIEIKTDSYDSGNIFFETVSSIENSTKGCMIKTEAYFLFYYFILTHELYIFNMNKYRKWVLGNQNCFKKACVKNEGFRSLGLLVPKEKIEKCFDKKYFRKVIIQ